MSEDLPDFMKEACTGTPDGRGSHVWRLAEPGEEGPLAQFCVVCGARPPEETVSDQSAREGDAK